MGGILCSLKIYYILCTHKSFIHDIVEVKVTDKPTCSWQEKNRTITCMMKKRTWVQVKDLALDRTAWNQQSEDLAEGELVFVNINVLH